MILHHYPNSPFAEKVRAIFGYKGLPWSSVIQPDIMPKPDLQALTGGYRRVPVLQMGADVYCDTALIAQIIEQIHPSPSLFGTANKGHIQSLSAWADDALFWAAMGYNFKGAAILFADDDPESAAAKGKAFVQDRAAMFGAMPRQHPNDATAAYAVYLKRISQMLSTQDYTFGGSPTLADFSLYHPLWFTLKRVPQMAHIFDPYPEILAWLTRMLGFTEKAKQLRMDMTPEQALEVARTSQPITLPAQANNHVHGAHGITLGALVSITAEKFGLEASTGELVSIDNQSYTIRRYSEDTGCVHVHFPHVGYALKAIN